MQVMEGWGCGAYHDGGATGQYRHCSGKCRWRSAEAKTGGWGGGGGRGHQQARQDSMAVTGSSSSSSRQEACRHPIRPLISSWESLAPTGFLQLPPALLTCAADGVRYSYNAGRPSVAGL
jgi:hypothetical protein